MKKWIVAAVVIVIVLAAAVWYKAGSAPAVAETPETAATATPAAVTPAPTASPETATPTSTEAPTPTQTPYNTEGLTQEQIDRGLHYNEEGALVDANGNYSMDNDDALHDGSSNMPENTNEIAHENGQAVHEMFNGEQAQEIHDKMAEILGRG